MFDFFKNLKLNTIQKLAMNRLMKMKPEERDRLMAEFLSPENIAKHKDEILAMIDNMEKSGQISKEQINLIKNKLGL